MCGILFDIGIFNPHMAPPTMSVQFQPVMQPQIIEQSPQIIDQSQIQPQFHTQIQHINQQIQQPMHQQQQQQPPPPTQQQIHLQHHQQQLQHQHQQHQQQQQMRSAMAQQQAQADAQQQKLNGVPFTVQNVQPQPVPFPPQVKFA